jgi:hypothetical protein
MRKHILYAYAEGSDFDLVARSITERLEEVVSTRTWTTGEASVVNQRTDDGTAEGSWELGINLELPDPGLEPEDWFSDIEEIAVACNEVSRTHQVPFVIGISDQQTGIADDLFGLDGGFIDIERLKAIIGTEAPK